MQKTKATCFGVSGSTVRDRDGELGQHHEGRDPVSICPAFLGPCAFAPISLLPDLNCLSHRRDVWLSARLGQSEQKPMRCFFAASSAAASLYH